jgi:Family of unknown function (DUF6464)
MAILSAVSIILLGLVPAIVSLWLLKQQLILASDRESLIYSTPSRRFFSPPPLPLDSYYLEGVGYLIGDITCEFNARSAYLRCAVNPLGFCSECRHYQAKDI